MSYNLCVCLWLINLNYCITGNGCPEGEPEIDSRLEEFGEINPIQLSVISPEPMDIPCNAIYTELVTYNPVLIGTALSHNTDEPGPTNVTTNIPGYHQDTPMLDFTTHSNDSNASYISGSDDNTFINMNRRYHQAEVEDFHSESVSIGLQDDNTSVLHKEPAVNKDIISTNGKNDSDETYIHDSDIETRPHHGLVISETSTDSEDNAPALPESKDIKSTRKRGRQPASWKCNKRRKDALSGKQHTSKNGKSVPAKSLKEPCSCRKKCYENINEESRMNIFRLFWDENKNWENKRQFILTCVKEKAVERQRIRSDDGVATKKREKTRLYHFIIDDDSKEVCQKFFLGTLGVSVTFVTNALRKSNCGMTLDDQRGKKEPRNKIKEELKNKIRKHIEEFPKYESHYSREKTKREYLGSHLTVEKLYSLFAEKSEKNGEEIPKNWLYRHIFNTEYNIGFKPPQTDTCDDCDRYEIQIREAEGEELKEIEQKRKKHMEEAASRYKRKAEDKESSLINSSEKMLTVDLQKCLPTPLLTNGQTFYLRKLWTLNYTILDSSSNKCTCVMWDESKAGRGGNELASGLMKWFMENVAENLNVKAVVIWSDNCAGQNKNMHLYACYLWLLKNITHLEVIEHKYLLKGHTHMEVDGIHSLIERHKNRQRQFSIATPWDWQQVVRACSSAKLPIDVINMEVEDFKNFAHLHDSKTSPFINRKKGTNGQNVPYIDMVYVRMSKDEYGILQYKTAFEDDNFQKVSLMRNQRTPCPQVPMPTPVRTGLNPISTNKFEDLQKTLTWIPQIFHDFYKNLPHVNGQRELDI